MSVFRLDLGMVMGGDEFEIHAHARRVGLEYKPTVKNTCILFLHQTRSILRDSKKYFISQNIFKYCYFIQCFFFLKYNSTNMEVIIAAVWYVISDLIPSINFKFLAWCELIWVISSTFLTGISFYFNEKLSHHLLTK